MIRERVSIDGATCDFINHGNGLIEIDWWMPGVKIESRLDPGMRFMAGGKWYIILECLFNLRRVLGVEEI